MAGVWTVSYLLAQRFTAGYTYLLFLPTIPWENSGFIMGTSGSLSLWVYVTCLSSFSVLVLFDSTFGALAWTGGAMAIFISF